MDEWTVWRLTPVRDTVDSIHTRGGGWPARGQRGESRPWPAFSISGKQDPPVATDSAVVALAVVLGCRNRDEPLGERTTKRVDSLPIPQHVPFHRMGQDIGYPQADGPEFFPKRPVFPLASGLNQDIADRTEDSSRPQ